jgi:hypothetical protein
VIKGLIIILQRRLEVEQEAALEIQVLALLSSRPAPEVLRIIVKVE